MAHTLLLRLFLISAGHELFAEKAILSLFRLSGTSQMQFMINEKFRHPTGTALRGVPIFI